MIDLINAHYDRVDQTVQQLKMATEALEVGDNEALEKRITECSRMEKEGDALRRRVMKNLIRSEMPHERKEFFHRLVVGCDAIADQAKEACRLLGVMAELPSMPALFPDLRKMANLSAEASMILKKTVQLSGAEEGEMVKNVAEIEKIEETVDDLELKLRKRSLSEKCDVWSALVLWRVIIGVERVADRIEDAADIVESMAI